MRLVVLYTEDVTERSYSGFQAHSTTAPVSVPTESDSLCPCRVVYSSWSMLLSIHLCLGKVYMGRMRFVKCFEKLGVHVMLLQASRATARDRPYPGTINHPRRLGRGDPLRSPCSVYLA